MSGWEIDYLAISAFGFGVFAILMVAGIATVVFFLIGFFKDRWTLVPWTLVPAIASIVGFYAGGNRWLMDWAQVNAKKSSLLALGYRTVEGMARMASGYLPDFIAYGIPVAGAGATVGLLAYAIYRLSSAFASRRRADIDRPVSTEAAHSVASPGLTRRAVSRRLIAAGAAIAVAIAGTCWWAWDRGWIPGNMRAPTKEAFEAGIRESLLLGVNAESPVCVEPSSYPQPESVGGEGYLASPTVPGAYAVVLADQGKELRDKQLAQYRYLTKVGFFTEEPTTLRATDGTTIPASKFRLSLEGWLNSESGRPCFRVGYREFSEVTDFVPSGKTALGIEAWRVGYRMAIKRLVPWAATDTAKLLFANLQQDSQGTPQSIELYRGNQRWISATEASNMSRPGGYDAREQLRLARSVVPDTLSQAEVLDAIGRGSRGNPRVENVCLVLPEPYAFGPVQPGADGYVMKVFNLVQGYQPMSIQLDAWRRLEALTRAGLFERTVSNEANNQFGAPARGAVTYVLKEPYRRYFVKPNCLRIGSLAFDRMLIEKNPGGLQYRFYGHASLREPAAWSTEVPANNLPEVVYARTNGVVMRGSVTFPANIGQQNAPVAYVTVVAPVRDLRNEPLPSESIPGLKKLASAVAATPQTISSRTRKLVPLFAAPLARPSTPTPAMLTGPKFPAALLPFMWLRFTKAGKAPSPMDRFRRSVSTLPIRPSL